MSTTAPGGNATSFKVLQPTAASLWRLGFICVLVGGTWLRLRGLTFQSYWEDELFSVAVSDPHNSLWQVIQLTTADVHPPLFQLLLWAWFKLVGFSEFSGRLFPALFGIFALPVVYRLGCEVRNQTVGFSAMLLCAVNVFHLSYSQEVRSYSLLFFLGALSLLYFLRLLDQPRRKNLVGWVLVSTAMVYTHLFGGLALAAEMVALLWLLRRRPALRWPAVIATATFGVAVLPMLPMVIRSAGMSTFWINPPAAGFAVDYFLQYFGSRFVAAAIVLAMLYGALRYGADERSRGIRGLLLLWLVAVLLLPYIRSVLAIPMLTSRNTIIVLPVVLLLAALGIAAIRQPVARGLVLSSLLVFSMLHLFYYSHYYRSPTKTQTRQAAQALIAAHPDVDAVYASPEVVPNLNIYFALLDAPFRAQSLERLPSVDDSAKLPQRFWLIDARVRRVLTQPIMSDPRLHIIERKSFRCAGFAVLEPVR